MKLTSIVPLLCLLTFAGPVLAETATGSVPAETCPPIGPLEGASEACNASRAAFRAELQICMERKHAEADARAKRATEVNSHTNRARFRACDAETRAALGLVSK